jgi:hypothetical protein
VARARQGRERRAEHPAPYQERTFETASLADGIRRAIVWLDAAPPARREIVIESSLPIGSITQADVAAIPAGVGVRFERTGTLPATRTVPAGRLLTPDGVRAREVTFDGDRTSVSDASTDRLDWPIEVIPSNRDRPTVDAAIAAVLSQRVWAGPPDCRARLYFAEVTQPIQRPPAWGRALFIAQPWIADAIARIARDRDLREAASRVTAGLAAAEFMEAPWQTVAAAADGRPLVVASGSEKGIVVVSGAPALDVATPLLLRSIANAIGAIPELQGAEVVPIADAVLQRWSRPAAPLTTPRIESVDEDDRRWLWIAVLCLMAIEMWIRRARAADLSPVRREEDARVA